VSADANEQAKALFHGRLLRTTVTDRRYKLKVAEIIRARCSRREAVARLRRWAEDSVIETDRKPFVAAAEETLAGIHEGNFARYRVRPSEFEAWKTAWD